MLKITKNLNLKDFSGLRVGDVSCRNLYEVENLQDFQELLDLVGNEVVSKMIVVGEGSNMVFVGENNNLDLLRINIKTMMHLHSSPWEGAEANAEAEGVKVGAGVNWDLFVQKYIELGGLGMESLSAIPGTVGAVPVQNIGAYGKEVAEFIESVEVYDKKENIFKTLNKNECEFKYRDSIFKDNKNRYIVLYVNFILSPSPSPSERGASAQVQIPDYKDIKNYLLNKNSITKASDLWNKSALAPLSEGEGLGVRHSIQEIREAVIEVRKLKLPDPSVIPNCGSFFKNAIIDRGELEILKTKFPEIPAFPVEGMRTEHLQSQLQKEASALVKVPVAYIIEKIGLKGYNSDLQIGNFGIHKEHALIITGNGKGDVKEFLEFVNFIKQKVYDASGLLLEEEVNFV